MIRDRDTCYGHIVSKRLSAMGIRDHPIGPRSPWQNGQAERLIGSIRRNASITSSSLATPICVGYLRLTQDITTNSERICRWTRNRRTSGPSNDAVTSPRGQFSADFIINIAGCSYRQ